MLHHPRFTLWLIALLLGSCSLMQGVPPAARAELAPHGKLRAAINFGNPVLARRAGGEVRGVSIDLSRALAARLGVPLEFVIYESAGHVAFAAPGDDWDVAFLAIDPERSRDMLQSNPYLIIEGAYLVAADSPIQRNEDVDRDGVRIAVGKGSAYDLFLSREIKRAMLVRAPTSPEVVSTMIRENLEVAAGVRQQLEADAKRTAGVRLLPGRFMVINQAMAVPKGRDAGAGYVRQFVEEMKASGFVAQALVRHKVEGAAIAPADEPR
jgi:polar amino acid transport system substrate-binding protein